MLRVVNCYEENPLRLPLVCVVLALFSQSSRAGLVVLEVDFSDPSAVVFSNTGAFAENASSTHSSGAGITLLGILPGNTFGHNSEPPSLFSVLDSPAGTTRTPFTDIFVGNFGNWSTEDFNFFDEGPVIFTMQFRTDSAALAGGPVIVDLDSLKNSFAAVGATGNIVAGNPGLSPVVIGQWQVVPEPSAFLTLAVVSLGVAVCVSLRKFRKMAISRLSHV